MRQFVNIYIPVYMTVFFITAIVLPSWLLYKRTGINPVTFRRKTESAHDYIGFLFKIILATIAAYGFLNSFIRFSKIAFFNTIIWQISGIVVSGLSLIFIILAQKSMSNSWRIGIDEDAKAELITNGAFSVIRNPIFSGMLLSLASLFLLSPTYFMAYLAILSYIVTSIQVRLEEEYLERTHGKAYLDYKARVGRFLPRIMHRENSKK